MFGHSRLLRRPFSNPVFFENDMLHAFPFGDKVAVDGMNLIVSRLDHGRIVERASRLIFQMPSPLPGLPLILGKRYRQSMTPLLGIVVDQ